MSVVMPGTEWKGIRMTVRKKVAMGTGRQTRLVESASYYNLIGISVWPVLKAKNAGTRRVRGGFAWNTVIRRGGARLENNLMKVLRGHDGGSCSIQRKRVVQGLLLVGSVAASVGHRNEKEMSYPGAGKGLVEDRKVREGNVVVCSRLGLDVNQACILSLPPYYLHATGTVNVENHLPRNATTVVRASLQ